MLLVAHRGNFEGPKPELENSLSYVSLALEQGFHCEVDLWKYDNDLWLGHDGPEHRVSRDYILEHSRKLWLHCKNLEALQFISEHKAILNGFWHEEDSYSLTTKGYIWTFPGKSVTPLSVIVDNSRHATKSVSPSAFGVCGDYVGLTAI